MLREKGHATILPLSTSCCKNPKQGEVYAVCSLLGTLNGQCSRKVPLVWARAAGFFYTDSLVVALRTYGIWPNHNILSIHGRNF